MEDDSTRSTRVGSADDLLRLIDSAVASYSAEEPRPGLAQRVVATVSSADSRASRRYFPMARLYGLPVRIIAACLLITLGSATGWIARHLHFTGAGARTTASAEQVATRIPARTRDQASTGSRAVGELAPQSGVGRRTPATRPLSGKYLHPESGPGTATVNRAGNSQPAIFPTPSPLTAEERALLVLASRNSKDVQVSVLDTATPPDPISIAAIEIDPLPPPSTQSPSVPNPER